MSASAVRALLVVVVVAAGGATSGCYSLRADLPGTLRRPTPDEDILVVGRFDRSHTRYTFVRGLVAPEAADLFATEVREAVEAAGGDGLANIVWDTYFDPIDIVVGAASLGVVTPRTVRLRADIVRFSSTPLPGSPLLRRRAPPLPPRQRPPVSPAAPIDDPPPPTTTDLPPPSPAGEPPPPLDPAG